MLKFGWWLLLKGTTRKKDSSENLQRLHKCLMLLTATSYLRASLSPVGLNTWCLLHRLCSFSRSLARRSALPYRSTRLHEGARISFVTAQRLGSGPRSPFPGCPVGTHNLPGKILCAGAALPAESPSVCYQHPEFFSTLQCQEGSVGGKGDRMDAE